MLRDAGIEVYLTRRNDKDMSISGAFNLQISLTRCFVSLHLRIGKSRSQRFHDFPSPQSCLKLAETRLIHFETCNQVRCDRVHEQFVSTDVEDILMDMTINHAQVESAELAQSIQSPLQQLPFPNLGVRQAPFTFSWVDDAICRRRARFSQSSKEGPFSRVKRDKCLLVD